MKKGLALLLAACLTLTAPLALSGCAATRAGGPADGLEATPASAAADLMEGVEANPIAAVTDLTVSGAAVADFGVRLFQNSLEQGKNTLISPLSVLCALAMTANGARGETLAQMEAVLGMPVDELNAFVYSYMASLPESGKCVLSLANSIWFTEEAHFTAEPAFLQANADYYGAGLYQAPFDDSTRKEINDWVEEHTNGMIQDILDRIPEDAVMYLVNALAFEAEWMEIYTESQVRGGVFTGEDGTRREVELMYSEEHAYLEDEQAAGFLKYYAGGDYAFAALLPREGVSVAEYAASLTGERLYGLLSAPRETAVSAAIPKFKSEYTAEMSGTLSRMGMPDAFDWTAADFSGLGSSTEGNIVISRVLHKTLIEVDARGTKAGAATAVEMVRQSAMEPPEEVKTVILDRPFVYLLIDCETNLPFFIGTVMEVTD